MSFKFDKVLVTGGAGFIGSHTVDLLLTQGVKVWVLDNLSSGSLRNLRSWKGNRAFHFKKNTVTRYKVVESLSRKVEAVLHLAAIVSPYVSVKRPEIANETNVSGTLNVLRAAEKNGIQRVAFASSSSVYGNQSSLPISEDNPIHPVTPYGASKVAGEKYCEAYFQTYGLSTVSLRYFNVYGVRQSANPYSGVIAIFANRISRGVCTSIYGDGEQTRDFVHVSDVANANLQALQLNNTSADVFNIGTGQPTTINQLFSFLAKMLGKPDISPVHAKDRPGDIRDSFANITRASSILGFKPKVELERGLVQLIESIENK
jgi:UDP-glucose 4-epimerase